MNRDSDNNSTVVGRAQIGGQWYDAHRWSSQGVLIRDKVTVPQAEESNILEWTVLVDDAGNEYEAPVIKADEARINDGIEL